MDLGAEFCWIDVIATADGVTVHVRGEIDLATAPLLDAALDGVDGHGVEIDLSATTFCDGAGLRVLELAHQRFGPGLRVTGASPLLRRLASMLDMEWLAVDAIEADPPVR